jgi:thioredoxin reductase
VTRHGEAAVRRVLLATGMQYVPPDLPGVAERWGNAVFHCPFCHGWEARDGALAVLDGGDTAVFRALLLRGWSDDVVLLGREVELAAAGTIAVDELDRTSVPGVFAAGDVAGTIQMVPAAMGDGARTGAQVRLSLLAEDHDLPFPPGAAAQPR